MTTTRAWDQDYNLLATMIDTNDAAELRVEHHSTRATLTIIGPNPLATEVLNAGLLPALYLTIDNEDGTSRITLKVDRAERNTAGTCYACGHPKPERTEISGELVPMPIVNGITAGQRG